MRRLLLLIAVACGLAPGTWLRSPPPPTDNRQELLIVRLPAPGALGPVEVLGAWWLQSPNSHFGSYSALVALGDGTLLAGSDRGRVLRFAPPGAEPVAPRFGFLGPAQDIKWLVDLEALTRDPATGSVWAAYEGANEIVRYDARLRRTAATQPPDMASWPSNGGPEAMARLADGRFIVLSEGDSRWLAEGGPGLLFDADPTAGAEALSFRFVPLLGSSPVDMAALPDGRVLVLLRAVEWGVPPAFVGKLVVADPAEIREGQAWPWRALADLRDPLPTDNYEGLAVEVDASGAAILWLISDDNQMRVQRTVLLKLRWDPDADKKKARGSPARLRESR